MSGSPLGSRVCSTVATCPQLLCPDAFSERCRSMHFYRKTSRAHNGRIQPHPSHSRTLQPQLGSVDPSKQPHQPLDPNRIQARSKSPSALPRTDLATGRTILFPLAKRDLRLPRHSALESQQRHRRRFRCRAPNPPPPPSRSYNPPDPLPSHL